MRWTINIIIRPIFMVYITTIVIMSNIIVICPITMTTIIMIIPI